MSWKAIPSLNAPVRVTSAKAEKYLGAAFRPFTTTIADIVWWAAVGPRGDRGQSTQSSSDRRQHS
jgi:hypothetical protein